MKEKYPKWIDEYAKSFHNGFSHMVPCSWGPVDVYVVLDLLNGSFLSKLHKTIVEIKKKNVSIENVARSFSCPSTLRAAFYWVVLEYQYSDVKNKKQFKEIIEFFIKVLNHLAKKDIFGYKSNIAHSQQEINKLLADTKWQKGSRDKARQIGKLYSSLASLVFALYRDFYPQDSHEIYGPYDASKKFGPKNILLIKHFPKIKPVEIWPEIKKLKYQDIKIFQVYKNVRFSCEIIGLHSIYKGNLIDNLVAYAVVVDGKYRNQLSQIKALTDYLAEMAIKQSSAYDSLSKEDLKKKVLEWHCYQFFNFFKLAEIDWRPTREMFEAVKNKKVPDRFELNKFPSFKEYMTSPEHEIYWLKDLY
ncbi:MAG TPA: hypothetical protein ENI16_00575 [Candidatus Portnoybacteria bacterium]|nr:hypothetical protein [Candidatus Portnoybacteria bacterium]